MSAPALALALALAAHQYTPEDVDKLFRSANEAYLKGDFASAVEGYQRIVDDGYASADVQYNLGNAQHALGKLGPAMLAFERARRLDPGDEDAQLNLEKCRRELVDKVAGQAGEPFVDRVSTLAAPNAVALSFLGAWLLLWGGLVARRFLGAGSWSAALALLGLAASVPLGTLLGLQAYRDSSRHEAVVVAPVVKVFEGPSEHSKISFELHEGTSVRVVDRDGNFAKVRLSNNLEGWADAAAVTEI
jgi:tetratricopeptide (TPR) repeat protein